MFTSDSLRIEQDAARATGCDAAVLAFNGCTDEYVAAFVEHRWAGCGELTLDQWKLEARNSYAGTMKHLTSGKSTGRIAIIGGGFTADIVKAAEVSTAAKKTLELCRNFAPAFNPPPSGFQL